MIIATLVDMSADVSAPMLSDNSLIGTSAKSNLSLISLQDIEEIQALQVEIPIPAETIVLMPQGITPEELAPKQEWLVDICKEHSYRYSPRVHVDIWGDKRGV